VNTEIKVEPVLGLQLDDDHAVGVQEAQGPLGGAFCTHVGQLGN